MGVYDDLLTWLERRPVWQQDAARRLVQAGQTSRADVEELASLALAEAGGPPYAREPVPVSAMDVPVAAAAGPDIRVTTILATSNLNAIVAGSSLTFGSAGLTIVYGDNGSGKSGYVRLLKEACRARARAGSILPDVFAQAAGEPHATLAYSRGAEEATCEWSPGAPVPNELGRVSVFDRACASVYVTEENEVAYRPFGLDLLDALARLTQSVQAELELRRGRLHSALPAPPPETARAAPIADLLPLTSTTDRQAIESIPEEADEDAIEIASIERALASEDPSSRARAAKAVRAALDRVARRLQELAETVHDDRVADVRSSEQAARDAVAALEAMREVTEADQVLAGVGGDPWRRLWMAAEAYSRDAAYPEHEFPYVGPGARCVLCGQVLEGGASERLMRLRDSVRAELSSVADAARLEVIERRRPMESIAASAAADQELIDDLLEVLPDQVPLARLASERALARATAVLADANDEAIEDLVTMPDLSPIAAEIVRLDTEIALLERAADPAQAARLRTRLVDLKGAAWLVRFKQELLAELDRLSTVEALRTAIATCDTHPITIANNQLTERYVTVALQADVARELEGLNARRVRVRLAWRGERAVSYHRFELHGATHVGAHVEEVVSEGEFGALALAAFLAEVNQQADASTIVLDDPVSSLDHQFRGRVAARLAREASTRPVVVFTHDLVFLQELESAVAAVGGDVHLRNLRVIGSGVGVPGDGAPWRGAAVGARVEELRRRIGGLRTLYDAGEHEGYEVAARDWYGNLREAWERAVEEILFGSVILRYRHDIQTRRLTDARVWILEQADITQLDRGMSRASAWLRGHDQPLAVNQPLPAPDEIEQDVVDLETWVQSIRTRRRADGRATPTGG